MRTGEQGMASSSLSFVIEWSRPRTALLGLAVPAGLVLLAAFGPWDSSGATRSFAAWLGLFFFPGGLLSFLLLRREVSLGGLVALSFGLGLAVFAPVCLLAHIFRWPFTLLVALLLVGIVGLLACLFVGKVRSRVSLDGRGLFILVLGLAFSVLLFRAGAYQDGDAITHMTWIRRLYERGIADPTVFGPLPSGPVWVPYLYNAWDTAVALISRVAGIDPVHVWISLPALLVIPGVFSFWYLAKVLFRSERAAFVVALFYLLLDGVYKGMWPWSLSPYPDQVGKFLLVIGLSLAVTYIHERRRRFLWVTVVAGFALLLTHVSSFTYLYALLGFYALGAAILRETRSTAKRAAIAVAIGLLVATPILALQLRHLASAPTWVEQLGFLQGGFEGEEFTSLPFNLFIVDYRVLFSQSRSYPYLYLYHALVVALVPFMGIRYWRERVPWAIFLSAGVAGTLLLYIFNPLVVTFVIRFLNGNLASRAAYLIPFLGVFAVGGNVSRLIEYVEKKLPRVRFTATAAALFLAAALAVSIVLPGREDFRYAETLTKTLRTEKSSGYLLRNADARRFIGENTPESSVILSSSVSEASLIGPYFDRYPLPPRVGILAGVDQVLDPTSEFSYETLETLDRYQVGYVLTGSPMEAAKLDEYPSVFRRTWTGNGHGLYEVLTASPAAASNECYRQGVLALEEGDLDEAGSSFSRAVRLDPANTMAEDRLEALAVRLVENGIDAREAGALAEAAKAFTSALAIRPDNPEVKTYLRGVACDYLVRSADRLSTGDRKGAFFDLRDALSIDPTDAEAKSRLQELARLLQASGEAALVPVSGNPVDDSAHSVQNCYTIDRGPDYWNPVGTELVDGGWDSTRNSVAWRMEGGAVAIDFDLQEIYPLYEISIRNTHFTGNYGQGVWGIVVLASEDDEEFSRVGEVPFLKGELGAGEHVWSMPAYVNARYVRILVVGSGGLVTLGEVEILGYVFAD